MPRSLHVVRKWVIALAVLHLLLGAFSLWLGGAEGGQLDRMMNNLLSEFGKVMLALGVTLFVLAWGLRRAHAWALALTALVEAGALAATTRSLLDEFTWPVALRALLASYLLSLLLSRESLAAVGLWRSRARNAPAPYDMRAGYQPPARW